jgi:hypothetical protein
LGQNFWSLEDADDMEKAFRTANYLVNGPKAACLLLLQLLLSFG